MYFWIAVTIIAVIAIIFSFITNIVKMSQKHFENMERIKHGYPTIDQERNMKKGKVDYIDLTAEPTTEQRRN
jgi:hypothetical protein